MTLALKIRKILKTADFFRATSISEEIETFDFLDKKLKKQIKNRHNDQNLFLSFLLAATAFTKVKEKFQRNKTN